MSVGTKPALVDLDADLLEAEALRVGAHADRDEHAVGLDGLGLAADFDADRERAVLLLLVAHGLGALVDLRAELDHLALDDRRAVGIDAGEERGRRLDDREARAELLVDAAELEADDAAADDEQALRDLAQAHRLFGADDSAWSNLNVGISMVDEPVAMTIDFGFDGLFLARRRSSLRRVFGPVTRRGARDELGAVALEQTADAAGELLDDARPSSPASR